MIYTIVPAPRKDVFRLIDENGNLLVQGEMRDCEEEKLRREVCDGKPDCKRCGHPMHDHLRPSGTELEVYIPFKATVGRILGHCERPACNWSPGCYGGWCTCKGYKP